jgi:deazaflavin-dependent oxidoreductase (nitroreductase family)
MWRDEETSMAVGKIGQIANSTVRFVVGKIGLNLQGAEVLVVRGRKSGQVRSTVVNPVEVDGVRYLFSPRGETQWVKNIRVTGEGTLRRGRGKTSFRVEELTDDEKAPVIRAYLDRWHWQVGAIMGVDKHPDDAALRDLAPKHPVFRMLAK